jgi:predicted transposase/invertase (TIGR01784 family)
LGRKNGKIETAQKLIKLGLSIDDIVKVTELSKEEIEKLK